MTEKKVIEILSNQLRVESEKINAQTNIATDLGADSLDLVEVLMSLEDEFNISVSDEESVTLKTVADIVKMIDSKIKK